MSYVVWFMCLYVVVSLQRFVYVVTYCCYCCLSNMFHGLLLILHRQGDLRRVRAGGLALLPQRLAAATACEPVTSCVQGAVQHNHVQCINRTM